MDDDQLDLKITGHMVTPGRVLEDGWIGVRGKTVAAGGVPTYRVELQARADHADGTPMADRCDALADAAQVGDVAGQRGLRAVVDLLSREEPVPADPAVGSALAEAADRTGRLAP